MNIIPAIDLKNGKCVRLVRGSLEEVTIYNDDPISQAKIFEKLGCKIIHIVDLDAATHGSNENFDTIKNIIRNVSIKIQLGGGIRTYEQLLYWINLGIDNLIIGSIAVENTNLALETINKYPNKISIGIDDKNNKVMVNGWKKESQISPENLVKLFNDYKIRGFIYTDVNRDGTLEGLNIEKIKKFSTITKKNIILGGGVKTIKDIIKIKQLKKPNIQGIIVGKAIYSGSLNLKDAIKYIKNA